MCQSSYRNLVLASGHLVCYRLASKSGALHLNDGAINLRDAYVCSGTFATQSLPRREFQNHNAPKRYQDGLESYDPDEDVTFILWLVPSHCEMFKVDVSYFQVQAITGWYSAQEYNQKQDCAAAE